MLSSRLTGFVFSVFLLAGCASTATMSDQHVNLGQANRKLTITVVPGVGWDCFEEWLEPVSTGPEHLRSIGYGFVRLDVDGLSSSEDNARQIRDAIMAMPRTDKHLVLLGYSKGAPDILEAVVNHPEIHDRVVVVVSAAGSVDEIT